MIDRLASFWLSLHGRARQIDSDQALLGALGVAAFAYPHQIENVTEMATDTACRFLLADEVGLGKTIQALMLLRTLAAQRQTGLRVALVTPDDLSHQWIEEVLCRTHVGSSGVPVEPNEDSSPPFAKKGRIAMELYRPARLAAGLVRLNAKLYDVLVVDEYPKLSQQMRELVGTASRSIPNVLLLSATPAMHDKAMRRAILDILEPDVAIRANASGLDILELLREREDLGSEFANGTLAEQKGYETPPNQAHAYYSRTHGMFRRVIRTRRIDYPNALPQRSYEPIIVAPTDGDADRVDAARRYLRAAITENLNVRSENLLQTALASHQALINRASTLKRPTPTMAAAVRQLDAAARDPGDAKLDALIDHLRATFTAEPTARVVVVADDNRSVDYLAVAIERLVEVQVAKKRRAYGGADVELDVHVSELRSEVEAFESGAAKVLVAADVAAEGHNFQFANELIFYVLPWDPREVDQWIGRLDRLGGRGRPGKRTIRITPVVTRSSIEARILEVYEAADIFSGGRVFDEDAWTSLAAAIDVAAYGADADWDALVLAARGRRDDEEGWRALSKFAAPCNATAAKARFAALSSQRYALAFDHPDLTGKPNWFLEREIGAQRLLSLADELGVLRLRTQRDDNTGQKFRTLWYARRPEVGDIIVPEIDTTNAHHHEALLLRRSDLHSPPNSNIGSRRLHFFDHGDPLHDSVVEAFSALPRESKAKVEHLVRFPERHPGATYSGERIVLLIGSFRPASGPPFDPSVIQDRPSAGDSQTERDIVQAAVRRSYEEHLADARWFTHLAPPQFYVLAAKLGDEPQLVQPSLFIGTVDQQAVPRHVTSRDLMVADITRVAKAREFLVAKLKELMRVEIRQRTDHLASALPLRLLKSRIEGNEAIAAAEAVDRVGQARGGNLAFDRARRRANELAVLLAEVGAEMRQRHLGRMLKSLQSTTCDTTVVVLNIQ